MRRYIYIYSARELWHIIIMFVAALTSEYELLLQVSVGNKLRLIETNGLFFIFYIYTCIFLHISV